MKRIPKGFRIVTKALGLIILIIGGLISFYTSQVKGLEVIGVYFFASIGFILAILGILMIITRIEII